MNNDPGHKHVSLPSSRLEDCLDCLVFFSTTLNLRYQMKANSRQDAWTPLAWPLIVATIVLYTL